MSGNNRVLSTGYKKQGDTIHFKRLAVKELLLLVQEGKIFHGHLVISQQKFKAVSEFEKALGVADSLMAAISAEGWAPKLAEGRDLMFIQVIPDSVMSTLDVLGFMNLRHRVESKIDNALLSAGAGEWVGGDMGAGANMLFEVDNWDNANQMAMKILKDEDLLDHVLIAKRVLISSDDWQYEIVYPVEFEGVFNDL
ncbi:hypothetical protein [Chryseolinea lacunae]|uniref:Uncharacterized protein n=1 Tax=Chryseolinea lacunae TaxID=2801331 RepID=A0ABS1KMP6_9BACT|nr:hypothetical protein [Chryseolinea lacunae]MBL0740748.1 hypothetical protein [Chryseolinea lacunae]